MKTLLSLALLIFLLWSAQPSDAALIWYSRFDQNTGTTVTPDVGSQTCAFTNSPTWTTGKYNFGIDFDSGTTDYLDCGSTHITSTNDWTVTAWIKLEAAAAWRIAVHSGDHDGANRSGWNLAINNIDKLVCQVYVGGAAEDAASAASVDETGAVWTHVACKKSGTALTLWINGSQDGSATLSGSTMDYTGTAPKFFIGAQGNVTSPFLGQMDEVCIFNAAEDVAALYARGPCGGGGMMRRRQ